MLSKMRFRFRFWSVCRRTLLPTRSFRMTNQLIDMLKKMLREEFTKSSFTLNHHTPEHFFRCHWQKSKNVHPAWLAYRAFIVLYCICTLIYCVVPFGRELPEESGKKYLIFLTHWTYLVEIFQFILALIIAILRKVQESKESELPPMDKMPWYYKMYWLFFTIAISGSFVVTLVFWTAVYDEKKYPVDASNIIQHVLNSVIMLIDFWLVGHPVRYLHFYIPACYALLYTLFSVIYQLSGGTGVKGMIPIYDILDWETPFRAIVTCFISLCVLLFVHFLFFLQSFCKFTLYPKPRNDT